MHVSAAGGEAAIQATLLMAAARDLFARSWSAQDAVTRLYGEFHPGIKALAEALAAVWGGVELDIGPSAPNTGRLARLLLSTGAWPRSVCAVVSAVTLASWHGGLARKSLTDAGALPYPARNQFRSPDIICNGSQRASADEIDRWSSLRGWSEAPWVPPVASNNFLYVRAQNRFPGLIGGQISLYSYRIGIGPRSPSAWKAVPTDSESQFSTLSPVQPGAVLMTADDPFVLNPGGQTALALVAMVSTPYLPNTRPPDSNFALANWLRWNGGTAWRSMILPDTDAVSLGLSNHNASPERFRIEVQGRNIPSGTNIRLSSTGPGAVFDSGPLRVPGPNEAVSFDVSLQARHDGTVAVEIETPDRGPLPQDASVVLRNLWLVDAAHDEFDQAAALLVRLGETLDETSTVALSLGECALGGSA
jgi:hypothetical protein